MDGFVKRSTSAADFSVFDPLSQPSPRSAKTYENRARGPACRKTDSFRCLSRGTYRSFFGVSGKRFEFLKAAPDLGLCRNRMRKVGIGMVSSPIARTFSSTMACQFTAILTASPLAFGFGGIWPPRRGCRDGVLVHSAEDPTVPMSSAAQAPVLVGAREGHASPRRLTTVLHAAGAQLI